MTEEQKAALRGQLYSKSIRELVEIVISAQEELEEAKLLRRRMMQIRNLCLDPDERRKPGRPKKTSDNV